MCIGILMRDISSPLFGEIVLGAEVALQEAGYSTLLTNSHGRGDVDAERIGLLRRRRVDGMLLSLEAGERIAQRAVGRPDRGGEVLLGRELEAISRFDFHRGHAFGHQPLGPHQRRYIQFLRRGGASCVHRGLDAATGARDLFVGNPAKPFLEFLDARLVAW